MSTKPSFRARIEYAVGRATLPLAHRINKSFGDWWGHRLGFHRWLHESWTYVHDAQCTSVRLEKLLRPGGWITKCETCGVTVEIRLSCWETPDGHIPPETVKWIMDEVKAFHASMSD